MHQTTVNMTTTDKIFMNIFKNNRLSTSCIQLTGGNNPTQLGQQIAQSAFGGIGHE
jgi:hypothetical protein